MENDRVVGGDPSDPLIYVGRGHAKEVTPITPIPPEASQRTPNMFKGAVKAYKRFNPYTMGAVLAQKAVDWIMANKQKPFFLYLATPHIHHPFTPGKRFQGSSQCGLYGDFIQELDWMVGEVLKCLDEQYLAGNTLVILTSDNGGMFNTAAQAAFRAGHRINGDLLGFKFGVWEGGHRVPFIARWPGKIKPGTRSDQLICLVDMLATFAALTGQNLDPAQLGDSVNILPALLGEPESPLRSDLVLAPRQPTHLSVRRGKWMYIPARGSGGFTGTKPGMHTFAGPAAAMFTGHRNSDIENGRIKKDAPPAQLYDLEADVKQTQNLYDKYPEVRQEMAALLDSYRSKNKATDAKKVPAREAGARQRGKKTAPSATRPPSRAPRARMSKPNFIVIFAHDQAYEDLGCFGGKGCATPAWYDLQQDIGDTRNVLKNHLDVVARLRAYVAAFEQDLAWNSRRAGFIDKLKPFSK